MSIQKLWSPGAWHCLVLQSTYLSSTQALWVLCLPQLWRSAGNSIIWSCSLTHGQVAVVLPGWHTSGGRELTAREVWAAKGGPAADRGWGIPGILSTECGNGVWQFMSKPLVQNPCNQSATHLDELLDKVICLYCIVVVLIFMHVHVQVLMCMCALSAMCMYIWWMQKQINILYICVHKVQCSCFFTVS